MKKTIEDERLVAGSITRKKMEKKLALNKDANELLNEYRYSKKKHIKAWQNKRHI